MFSESVNGSLSDEEGQESKAEEENKEKEKNKGTMDFMNEIEELKRWYEKTMKKDDEYSDDEDFECDTLKTQKRIDWMDR